MGNSLNHKKVGCILLAGLLLLLGACTGKGGEEESSATLSLPAAASGPAKSAAPAPAEIDRELREVGYRRSATSPSGDGIYSVELELIPEKSKNGQFLWGKRLYFHDFATRQSRPLHVPGTENGYLYEDKDQFIPLYFVVGEKLVLLSNGKVETLNLDLSGREILLETSAESFTGQSVFADEQYIYMVLFKWEQEQPVQQMVKLDVVRGDISIFYTLSVEESLAGLYENLFVLEVPEYRETGGAAKTVQFDTLHPDTAAREELFTLQANEDGFNSCYITEDYVFWQNIGEPSFRLQSLTSGETVDFQEAEPAHYYALRPPLCAMDGRLLVMAQGRDGATQRYLYVDLTTMELVPIQTNTTNKNEGYPVEYPFVLASYEDYYLLATDVLKGETWAFTVEGEVVQMEIPEETDPADLGLEGYTADRIAQYVLVNKEDYWQGKDNYIPFTIMPLS